MFTGTRKFGRHVIKQLARGRTLYYFIIGMVIIVLGPLSGMGAWYLWQFIRMHWPWSLG